MSSDSTDRRGSAAPRAAKGLGASRGSAAAGKERVGSWGAGLRALAVWLVGGTALGLVEMSFAGAGPEVSFNSYSLAGFMVYYWVPAAVGGLVVWAALAVASRLRGATPDPIAWAVGLFAAAVVFIYVGLAINGMLKGPPTTPVGIGANLAVAAAAVGIGVLAGSIAGVIALALRGRPAGALSLGAVFVAFLAYLAWAWGNIDPGFEGDSAHSEGGSPPSIILIIIDALRADHLSLNGYDRETAPFLTRMAHEGASFDSAFSQATITVRSMASLFTSLYPRMHGVMSSGLKISESTPTLPEVLSRAGYATAGFGGGNPALFHNAGIVRGYDYYDDCRSIVNLVPQRILSRTGLVSKVDIGSARTTPPAEIMFSKAESWLDHGPPGPLFMFIQLMDVHAPYLPPDGYADKFGTAPAGIRSDVRLNRKCNRLVLGKSQKFFELVEAGAFDRMDELDITDEDVSEEELRRLIDLYDGAIAYADSRLEMFVEGLSERGILDDAVVIVTADHGEGFLDHGRLFHSGDLVYDELMRVPLVMRYPKAAPAGEVVEEPVGLIDVMPTVLDLAGVEPGAEPDLYMEGRSLLPLLEGDEDESARRLKGEVYCEGALVSCVRTPGWKFIDSPGHNTLELYHLITDPGEKVNLFAHREEVAARMAARLDHYDELVRRYREAHPGPTRIAVDEETRKRLRALGYVE